MTRSQGRGIRRGRGAGLGPGRRGGGGRGSGKTPSKGCLLLGFVLIAVPLFLTAFAIGWVM